MLLVLEDIASFIGGKSTQVKKESHDRVKRLMRMCDSFFK